MQTYIALFRAINVTGHNLLPMKELKALLENLGAENVKTYIQSGNVLIKHNEKNKTMLADKIKSAVKKKYGFEPKVLLFKKKEIEKAYKSNPFPGGEENPKTLHAFFLTQKPGNPNFTKMDEIKLSTEQFKLIDNILYFYAPDGVGRSKLAARIEKLLGVAATGRNWRTVQKLVEMVNEAN
ncbi:MAG: DUF1697 domain-containing protein [Melioribacteraceae bacterium]|nr:DUF1697 domain-containing protein [Melioribacteraceae bacterium]MCF8355417.1 DUF1697 domain-containing protein [Melioribacteraceae bacterium]MCF8393259.1 DUF1697 domain-containing protein [Melioribacteraceae bacterium]MCF8417560.1 DUF1697 domain-containing protein [Melioribacteraceae bacterium]